LELCLAMPTLAYSFYLIPPVPVFVFSFQVDATHSDLHSFPTRRSSDLVVILGVARFARLIAPVGLVMATDVVPVIVPAPLIPPADRKSTRLNSRHLGTSYPIFRSIPIFTRDSVPPVALIAFVVVMPPLA